MVWMHAACLYYSFPKGVDSVSPSTPSLALNSQIQERDSLTLKGYSMDRSPSNLSQGDLFRYVPVHLVVFASAVHCHWSCPVRVNSKNWKGLKGVPLLTNFCFCSGAFFIWCWVRSMQKTWAATWDKPFLLSLHEKHKPWDLWNAVSSLSIFQSLVTLKELLRESL